MAVANTPSTQAAGAGISAASTARSSRKPADITTNTNSAIAPTAPWIVTAPLIQNSPASGGAATSDATSGRPPGHRCTPSAAMPAGAQRPTVSKEIHRKEKNGDEGTRQRHRE